MKFHLLLLLLLLLFIPSCQPGMFPPNPEQPGHRNSITEEGRFAVTATALLQCSQCSSSCTNLLHTHTEAQLTSHTLHSQQPCCVGVPVLSSEQQMSRPYVSSLRILTAWDSLRARVCGKGKGSGEMQYHLTGGENSSLGKRC